MSEPKFKVIRVTIEEDYLIEMFDDERTNINGWTIDEIIEDWFTLRGAGYAHATRSSRQLGGSKKYIKHEIMDLDKSAR